MDFNFKAILIQAPVIFFALTVHEFCHAWVATMLGDDTAKSQGRLTLNPVAHLDVLGTILMFIVGFGWAKPVPVNALKFKDPRRGMLLVAIAGPLSNLIMAVAAGVALRFIIPAISGVGLGSRLSDVISVVLVMIILTLIYGLALAIFNMIPIAPLDGSRVLYGLLPLRYADAYSRLEPYGMIILFALFIFGDKVFTYALWHPVSIFSELLSGYDYLQLSYFWRSLVS
jgi:Zn-dependent protease